MCYFSASQLQYPEFVEDKSWRQLNGIISGEPEFVPVRLLFKIQ